MSIYRSCYIPDWVYDIEYNHTIDPQNPSSDLLATGSNCQVFAYTLLRWNGKIVPNLWSDEMWNDQDYSQYVESDKIEPMDLLFFSKTLSPYGAHVGVYLGSNEVIHNSIIEGKVSVWRMMKFEKYEKYRVLLGGKRFIRDV